MVNFASRTRIDFVAGILANMAKGILAKMAKGILANATTGKATILAGVHFSVDETLKRSDAH